MVPYLSRTVSKLVFSREILMSYIDFGGLMDYSSKIMSNECDFKVFKNQINYKSHFQIISL